MKNKLILSLVAFVALGVLAVLPSAADAQLGAGKLLRTLDTSAVYYIADDGLRYVFPNANIFHSWYENFDGVETIEPESLADYPFGGVMPYKPGKRMVKMKTSPKVYLVAEDGSLRWVKTERLARRLYGEQWMHMIDDLPESFFVQYDEGDDVEEDEDLDPEQLSDDAGDGSETLGKRSGRRHGHNKVTLCHNMDGFMRTLYLPQPAVDAHLRNHDGDFLGECDYESPDDDSGDRGDSGSDGDDDVVDPNADAIALLTNTVFHLVEYVKSSGFWVSTECPVEADATVGLLHGLSSGTIVDVDGNLTGTLTTTAFGNCTDQNGWIDLSVDGLAADSAYSYQVVFYDPTDGTTELHRLPAGEFTTYASVGDEPTVTFDVTVSDIAGTTAHVEWTSNYPTVGTDWADYGTGASNLDQNSGDVETSFDENGLRYAVDLSGLTPATDYFLVVNGYSWQDSGTVSTSDPAEEFTTLTP